MGADGSGRPNVPPGEAAENLAVGALDWLMGSGRNSDAGLTWAATATGDEADYTLYQGAAGIVLALLEAQRHFRDDRYGDVALRGAAAIGAAADHEESCSLYFGLAGMAVALHAVHDQLGDIPAAMAARQALDRVRSRFDGQRWDVMFELLSGNAGIALAALYAGDVELAVLAAEPYLRTADQTPGGVNWAVRPGHARSHHIAHGTLGIVYALAAVGAAAGRRDLTELALAGAADVVTRDEEAPAGFLVPHSDPPSSRRSPSASAPSWSRISPPRRPSMQTASAGPITNTARRPAPSTPVPDGRWATLASSASYCGSPARAVAPTPPTPFHGQTTRAPPMPDVPAGQSTAPLTSELTDTGAPACAGWPACGWP